MYRKYFVILHMYNNIVKDVQNGRRKSVVENA